MIIIQNFLTLFDFVSAHLEQFQVYEGLAKETQNGQLVMYTALRRVVLLALELGGNISKREGGKRKSKIALIRKYSSVAGSRLIRDIILT